ncbi:MAG: hypothetical protein IJD28_06365 [Deferribacterales bacterium]|nr:hypothetical protein [Deferribacterales bacterium]
MAVFTPKPSLQGEKGRSNPEETSVDFNICVCYIVFGRYGQAVGYFLKRGYAYAF